MIRHIGFGAALLASLLTASFFTPGMAQTPPAKMADIAFLEGTWRPVGTTSTRDALRFYTEDDGKVLFVRGHAGDANTLMLIYADDGVLQAHYTDGSSGRHYQASYVWPTQQVTFTTPDGAKVAGQINYKLTSPTRMTMTTTLAGKPDVVMEMQKVPSF